MVQLDREALAWAAGFFDGEGNISISRSDNHPYLTISVSQIDRRPLDRFQKAVLGVGKVRGPYSKQSPRKDVYSWTAHGFAPTQAVVALLWGFLSEPKRDQYRAKLAVVQSDANWDKPRRNKLLGL